MSNLTVKGNASGTGTVILEAPNTNTNRTITLPDAATTLVGTDATQTLTNKTIQGGAITLGTAVASTSGTAIDFTGIPSWAKRVTVMFSGVSTNGTSATLLQVGSTTFSTSGYTSSCGAINSGTAQAAQTIGFLLTTSPVSAGVVSSGFVALSFLSANNWVLSGSMQTNISSGGIFLSSGVSPSLAGTLDRVRITTVNGTDTFDAGTINIMWEG